MNVAQAHIIMYEYECTRTIIKSSLYLFQGESIRCYLNSILHYCLWSQQRLNFNKTWLRTCDSLWFFSQMKVHSNLEVEIFWRHCLITIINCMYFYCEVREIHGQSEKKFSLRFSQTQKQMDIFLHICHQIFPFLLSFYF